MSPQHVAEAHSHVFNIEITWRIEAQRGLLPHPEVDYAVEPPAVLMGSLQGETAQRSLLPNHPQLQDPSGVLSVLTLVAHIHMQNVRSSAVDIDLAFALVGQAHLVVAVTLKLERIIA